MGNEIWIAVAFGLVLLTVLDLFYVLCQRLVAATVGIKLQRVRLDVRNSGPVSSKPGKVGSKRAPTPTRIGVSWDDRTKRAGAYRAVHAAGFVGLAIWTAAFIVLRLTVPDPSRITRTALDVCIFEGCLVTYFKIRDSLKRGGDLKRIRTSLQYPRDSLQLGAMVRLSTEHIKGKRYRDWSEEDIAILSSRCGTDKWDAMSAWFRMYYLFDNGREQQALLAARQGVAIIENSRKPLEIRKKFYQFAAFLEAWVERTPERAEKLLRSVGPPEKGGMHSGLLAECAIAALHNQPEVLARKTEQLLADADKKDDPSTCDAAFAEWLDRIAARCSAAQA